MAEKPTYEELEKRVQELKQHDTTIRRCTKGALWDREAHLRTLIETIPDLVWLKDPHGVYLSCNRRFERFFGAKETEIVGKTDYDFVDKQLADFFREKDKAAITTGKPVVNEEEVTYADDGHTEFLETIKTPMYDSEGKLVGVLGISRDITERKRAKDTLQESESRLRTVFDVSQAGIILVDLQGVITFANQGMARMFGCTLQEVIGSSYSDHVHPDQRHIGDKRMRQLIAGEIDSVAYERNYIRSDGTGFYGFLSGRRHEDKQGNLISLVGIIADISEQKQAELSLRESEEKFRNFAEQSFVGFYIIQDGLLKYVNPKFADIFGYTVDDCLDNMSFHILVHPEDLALVEAQIRRRVSGESQSVQYKFRGIRKTGQIIHVEVYGSSLVYKGRPVAIGTVLDITKGLELERRLTQSQRIEAIGTLAGGIAHDFNNILSAIIGYTELIKMAMPLEKQLSGYLEEVLKAGNRAKDLVQQILTFSRQTEQELKPVSVKLVTKEALKLLRASLPSTIDIKQNITGDSLMMGDPTQIHQILMNLCTNAGHAMQENGGTLYVELADVTFDSFPPPSSPELKPGSYLKLTVSDTGHGMPPDVLERIFDPFFTTKEQGEGTGMGLAVVHGIVKSFGGVIYAYSEPGIGSSFNVFLPAIEATLAPERRREEVLPEGRERILFIDDEPALVEIGKKILCKLGYDVLTMTNPKEALDFFRTQPDRFDLVITDMTMPMITGVKLAREIFAIRKGIPVILCTGFSSGLSAEKAKEMGLSGFLMKPIIRSDLAKLVRKILDEVKG